MPREEFEEFRRLVMQDVSLQENLRDLIDPDRFADRVVELGIDRGFKFSSDEVAEAMRENKRAWIERWI